MIDVTRIGFHTQFIYTDVNTFPDSLDIYSINGTATLTHNIHIIKTFRFLSIITTDN